MRGERLAFLIEIVSPCVCFHRPSSMSLLPIIYVAHCLSFMTLLPIFLSLLVFCVGCSYPIFYVVYSPLCFSLNVPVLVILAPFVYVVYYPCACDSNSRGYSLTSHSSPLTSKNTPLTSKISPPHSSMQNYFQFP